VASSNSAADGIPAYILNGQKTRFEAVEASVSYIQRTHSKKQPGPTVSRFPLCTRGKNSVHFAKLAACAAQGMANHSTSSLILESISKSFGGVTALDGVSLTVTSGECHALMGENGAGKSTLGKIIAGILRPDTGSLFFEGRRQSFASPREARSAGIGMVHQELAFCPELTVAENLCLGDFPRHLGLFLDRKSMDRRSKALLADIAPDISPQTLMRDLSAAQMQLVQVAAAVGTGAGVLVFDEPTSSLSEGESRRLFGLLRGLRERGVSIVYISHRMPEVFELCDTISVLRDGRLVGSLRRSETTPDRLVTMMIGRPLEEYYPRHLEQPPGEELLRVDGLTSEGKFHDLSFSVRSGEVVGVAGLVGSGRSEMARAIFGLDPAARGTVAINGRDCSGLSPRRRMREGLALVPEDRKKQGLALVLSCRHNFSLTILERLMRWWFIDTRRELAALKRYCDMLRIKTASIGMPAGQLSGGNQQKIVVAKWLAREARVLILDEPTRGIDVGAKAAIHALIDELARQGLAILMISSELPEVLNLSTRFLVMREGRIAAAMPRGSTTQEEIMRSMAGLYSAFPEKQSGNSHEHH